MAPSVRCGRIVTAPRGGFYVQPDKNDPHLLIKRDDGRGFTASEATKIIESLDKEMALVRKGLSEGRLAEVEAELDHKQNALTEVRE